jgi:hypothetical protein
LRNWRGEDWEYALVMEEFLGVSGRDREQQYLFLFACFVSPTD